MFKKIIKIICAVFSQCCMITAFLAKTMNTEAVTRGVQPECPPPPPVQGSKKQTKTIRFRPQYAPECVI